MAIASILQWLSDPNRTYHHGRMLYDQYGSNLVTKTIIATGHQGSNYHFSTLEKALREICSLDIEAKAVIIPELHEFTKPEKPGVSDDQFNHLPDEVKDIRTKAKNLYNRSKFLHARIPLTDSPEQRLEMGLQLLDDFDNNRHLMGKVQEHINTGNIILEAEVLKNVKPVEDLSIKELMAESKNLPTYITKDKGKIKLEVIGSDRYLKLSARLNFRLDRLKEIHRRLSE